MSETKIHPESVYRRAVEPDGLAPDVRLVALEWALYFAVDGTRTVAELGRQFRADAADRDRAMARLASRGLIVEHPLTAVEYVHALAAAGDREERSMREFLIRAASPSTSSKVARPEANVMTADKPPSPPEPLLRTPRPVAPLAFRPLPPLERKEERTMAPTRKLSLRALMEVIERKAGSREAGQFDIYRVLIKVDTLLLKRSGIDTLRFTEDRLISDPELEEAIVRSLKKTLGIDCPNEVWVEVA